MIILAADIGGTHSRFAVFENDDESHVCLLKRHALLTESVGNFSQLVDQLTESELTEWLARCTDVVIAVPGPVQEGNAPNLPNVSWSLNTSQLQTCFPNTPKNNVHLINDFVAQSAVHHFLWSCGSKLRLVLTADRWPVYYRRRRRQEPFSGRSRRISRGICCFARPSPSAEEDSDLPERQRRKRTVGSGVLCRDND